VTLTSSLGKAKRSWRRRRSCRHASPRHCPVAPFAARRRAGRSWHCSTCSDDGGRFGCCGSYAPGRRRHSANCKRAAVQSRQAYWPIDFANSTRLPSSDATNAVTSSPRQAPTYSHAYSRSTNGPPAGRPRRPVPPGRFELPAGSAVGSRARDYRGVPMPVRSHLRRASCQEAVRNSVAFRTASSHEYELAERRRSVSSTEPISR
jgi:hypothetical protein